MAVVFNTAASTAGGTGTSLTLTKPGTRALGDLLVGMYITDGSGNPALPSGWTLLFSGQTGPSSSAGMDWIIGYVIDSGSDPSLAFTHTGSIWREGSVIRARSDIPATITLDAVSADGSTYNSTANPDPGAVTAVASSSLAFAVGAHWFGWSSAVTCTGYTSRSGGNGFDHVMLTKALSASGSENPAQFGGTIGSADDAWNGAAFTFTDAGGGGGGPTVKPLAALGVG